MSEITESKGTVNIREMSVEDVEGILDIEREVRGAIGR